MNQMDPRMFWAAVVGAVAAVLVLFLMFGPEDRVSGFKTAVGTAIGNDAYVCFAAHREQLSDPGAARLISSRRDEESLHIKFSGRNAFGGRITDIGECTIRNGNVSKSMAEIDALSYAIKK